jgi:aryl-alcohol dehydrogenase-like predicted oxidoreductase
MLSTLDASLGRLGTDHVDLWFVQRWSESAPLEETLSALELAVASGRARYVGVSNFSGWQTALAVAQAGRSVGAPLGLGVPVATQVEYSLLQRGIEREVLSACEALGLGVLAWSPLGRGVLTGKYRFGTPSDSRAASPHFTDFVGQYLDPDSTGIVDAVCTAADGLGVEPLDVALAWVRDRPGVASALVGARTAAQLRAVLAADEVLLPPEIRRALDEISIPEAGYPERF